MEQRQLKVKKKHYNNNENFPKIINRIYITFVYILDLRLKEIGTQAEKHDFLI